MTLSLGLAILALILVPFVPNLLRLRIRFFRWAHWDWAASIHEKYFDGLVLSVRVILFVIAVVLLFFAL